MRAEHYNPELAARIIRKLAEGNSFRWFDSEQAREQDFPSTATIRRWRIDDAAFDAECARASESHAEAEYDRMEDLERRSMLKPSDSEYVDPKAVNVVLSNMRWRLEKRKPRTFGQKLEVKATMTLEQLVGASVPESE